MTHPSLLDTAAALAAGSVSAESLVDAALTPDCPGAVEQRLERARADARDSDARRADGALRSPIDGVPFGVKANLDIAGVVTTNGTGLRGEPATRDAAVVAALRARGMVPVLTTTMAEAAVGAVTDNPHTGLCPNPRAPERHAGGSSGGSGAVVAAGLVPFALGSDTMGSVRIPAAYTGISGYKPSRGHLDVRGLAPLGGPLDTVGLLAPRPGDLLAAHDCIRGPSEDQQKERPPDRLVVGLPALCGDADPATQAVLEVGAARLAAAGYEVVRGTGPEVDAGAVRRLGLLYCELVLLRDYAIPYTSGDPGLSSPLRRLLDYAARLPEAESDLSRLEADLLRRGRELREQVSRYDVLLLPTTPGEVPFLGTDPHAAADFTAWVNAAGLPAVVLPADWPEPLTADRPGLQLVGRAGEDRALLILAGGLAGDDG
jgi:aspartyl-tRNA(Asn)/glutamyl-tRNA(Gln) amidotransferase subunit A